MDDGSVVSVGLPAGGTLVTASSPTRIATGSIALSGTNPTSISTGLNVILAAGATLKESATPGVATSIFTVTVPASGGTLSLYEWMVTSSANPTLVASTNTETVLWFAIGY